MNLYLFLFFIKIFWAIVKVVVEMGYEWPMNFSHFIFDQIYINDKNEKLSHCFSVNQAIRHQQPKKWWPSIWTVEENLTCKLHISISRLLFYLPPLSFVAKHI